MDWMVKTMALVGFLIEDIISHESEFGGTLIKERITC